LNWAAIHFSYSEQENYTMRQTKAKCKASELSDLLKIAALATLLLACLAAGSAAQQKNQKTFPSPEEVGKAFVATLQSNDEKAMDLDCGLRLV
jgi:ABC-type nitrate/sulfonate/bicarbonate transport system permease component